MVLDFSESATGLPLLISSKRNQMFPSSPEMLPGKVLSLPKVYPRNLTAALPPDKPHSLQPNTRSSRDQHVPIVGFEKAF